MSDPRRPKLLVVDDEAAQLQALKDTLQGSGFDVVGLASPAAGLVALREQRFDLLLSDLMMPGMDGISLMRAALEIDPGLVCVIMTGAGSIKSAVEAMQAGAFDYILKPFKLSAILPVLGRALAIRRLRNENLELQRRIQERSLELEAANVELDAFTRSASHDLRTPLIALIGLPELILATHGDSLPEEVRGWIAQIQASGQKMNRLIDDLLRLSRLGKQALRSAPVDVAALLQSCVAELAEAAGRPLPAVVVGALPVVEADESLLRQALLNLLSNAFKYTRATADPRIEVGTVPSTQPPLFFVRDNGSGFDMDHAARLFEAFQRLHSASEFEGTGVGLTIVQRIVQRHGGRIRAEGKPGEGATFYFTLAPEASAAG